jgi:ankyrin repeat protein
MSVYVVVLLFGRSLSTVEWMLSNGGDANARTSGGYTPLHFAARGGNATICRAIIAAWADINAVAYSGETPIIMAAQSGDVGDAGVGFTLKLRSGSSCVVCS